MNWLNSLDRALDRTFLPEVPDRRRDGDGEDGGAGGENADAAAAGTTNDDAAERAVAAASTARGATPPGMGAAPPPAPLGNAATMEPVTPIAMRRALSGSSLLDDGDDDDDVHDGSSEVLRSVGHLGDGDEIRHRLRPRPPPLPLPLPGRPPLHIIRAPRPPASASSASTASPSSAPAQHVVVSPLHSPRPSGFGPGGRVVPGYLVPRPRPADQRISNEREREEERGVDGEGGGGGGSSGADAESAPHLPRRLPPAPPLPLQVRRDRRAGGPAAARIGEGVERVLRPPPPPPPSPLEVEMTRPADADARAPPPPPPLSTVRPTPSVLSKRPLDGAPERSQYSPWRHRRTYDEDGARSDRDEYCSNEVDRDEPTQTAVATTPPATPAGESTSPERADRGGGGVAVSDASSPLRSLATAIATATAERGRPSPPLPPALPLPSSHPVAAAVESAPPPRRPHAVSASVPTSTPSPSPLLPPPRQRSDYDSQFVDGERSSSAAAALPTTGDGFGVGAVDPDVVGRDDADDGDSSSASSDGSDITSSSDEDEDEAFALDGLLPLPLWEDEPFRSGAPPPPLHPRYNRHGVFHVRLLLARRLPCPAGYAVRADVSLHPWRGTVRGSEKVRTYAGSKKAGVCLRWGGKQVTAASAVTHSRSDPTEALGAGGVDEDAAAVVVDGAMHSLIHPYNSEETPVPRIDVDLVSASSLGVTMFERGLCSLRLNCSPLMREPGAWRRRWCPASRPDAAGKAAAPGKASSTADPFSATEANEERTLVLLEACFEPSMQSGEIDEEGGDDDDDDGDDISNDETEEDESGAEEGLDDVPDLPLSVTFDRKPSGLAFEGGFGAVVAAGFDGSGHGGRLRLPSDDSSSACSTSVSAAAAARLASSPIGAPAPPPMPPPFDSTSSASTSASAAVAPSRLVDDESVSVVSRSSVSIAPSLTMTPRGQLRSKKKHKSHLLRIMPRYASTPSWCGACQSVVGMGWRRGYRCETCGVPCCDNCQLQLDLVLPCGSEEAREAARAGSATAYAARRAAERFPTVGTILSVVAPIQEEGGDDDGENAGDGEAVGGDGAGKTESRAADDNESSKDKVPGNDGGTGVGTLRLKVKSACLLEKASPPEADMDDVVAREERGAPLRTGDHYCRVTPTGSVNGGKGGEGTSSRRTRTVFQTAKPRFDGEEMDFSIEHYGVEFRLEVLDANTDRPVGSSLLTTQGLLQRQRDAMSVQEGLTLQSLLDPRRQRPWRSTVKLELRMGVKSGFGLDFFNAAKMKGSTAATAKDEGTRTAGEIRGWIEVEIFFQENVGLICGPDPKPCPPRPPPDFNVDLIQLHIARIGALVEDAKKAVENYQYLVSWNDPALTLMSLIVFVFSCIRFDTEYFGSLPILLLLLYMVYLAKIRRQGNFKQRWIRKEKDTRIEAEEKMAVSYSVHRPVGCLDVGVTCGRNLYSKELGLPGSLFASVLFDPVKFADEKTKKSIVKTDQLTRGYHEIGTTATGGLTANPVFSHIFESDETKRLKQLLPTTDVWDPEEDKGENEASDAGQQKPFVRFPLLQPLNRGTKIASIQPWETSPGAVIIQIRFQDVLNRLPVFDDLLGEVILPMSRLVKERKIEGWFQLHENGSYESSTPTLDDGIQYPVLVQRKPNIDDTSGDMAVKLACKEVETDDELAIAAVGYPEVYIKCSFQMPDQHKEISDAEKETSIVIGEEMIRSAVDTQDRKLGLIGSSIGALNTVRGIGGNVQFVQNQLGSVLDVLEQARNVFNFADPRKSTLVFVGLMLVWLVLAIIPTRLLVLAGGLGQFAATFYSAFVEGPKRQISSTDLAVTIDDDENPKQDPFVTRAMNFFTSLPTDEDLRRTYFWESRRVGERERQKLAASKRKSRLKKLWRAQWFGTLEVKEQLSQAGLTGREWIWETAFALLQGHRFVWWRSEKHFDDGEKPLGNIFFAGHAGLAGLSPLDLRELKPEEVPLVICIFGRGMEGQQKATLLASSSKVKEALETAVLNVSDKND